MGIFLKGYPSSQWDKHQLRYLHEQELKSKPGEEFWLTKIFVHIHQRTYLRWQQRNSKLHGDDNAHTKTNLFLRIKSFYAIQNDLSVQDHQPFCTPINDWKNRTGTEMKKWLNVHSKHIKVCLQKAKQRKTQQLQDLRNWMVKSTPQDASLEEEKPTRQRKKSKKQSKITQVFNVKIRPQTTFSQHTHKTKSSKQIPTTQESKSLTKYIQTMLKLRRERPSHRPSTTETNNSNKTSINDVIPVTLNNKTSIGNERLINV